MSKKPYSNSDDLDLIISSLYNSDRIVPVTRTSVSERKSSDMIESGIEHRILPISMRKRLLYNIAIKA